MKEKRKNIFWRKWKMAQSDCKDTIIAEKLKNEGIKTATFYKHCNCENIGAIDFSYIKIYARVFGLTLNELANE